MAEQRTGKSAATTTYEPANIPAGDAARFATIAQSTLANHASITHYTAPYASAVQRRTLPAEPSLWFVTSGTSSEALWTDRMNTIVPQLGMTPKGTAIGVCNDAKSFDTTCLVTADASFGGAQYSILFARQYGVSSAAIATSGTQNDLQVQVWDRHYDADPADGAAAVASLEERSTYLIAESQTFGLAWIPYHLMFAKLKTARPSVQLAVIGVVVGFLTGIVVSTGPITVPVFMAYVVLRMSAATFKLVVDGLMLSSGLSLLWVATR